VGYQFWKPLGLDDILSEAGLTGRAGALACVMTMNRLVRPSSELAMPDRIRRTALDDLMGIDFGLLGEDSLYGNLDRLHPRRRVTHSRVSLTTFGPRRSSMTNVGKDIRDGATIATDCLSRSRQSVYDVEVLRRGERGRSAGRRVAAIGGLNCQPRADQLPTEWSKCDNNSV